MTPQPNSAPERSTDRGFILAATGPLYRRAMRKAVRSLRSHHPDIAIDVYTDEPMDLPEVDQVIILPDGTSKTRPRFHMLKNNRFQHYIALDVDLLVLAPLHDVFDVLKHHDIAGAHEIFRNGQLGRTLWRKDIPAAFPQINGGVLGFRRSKEVIETINAWETAYLEHGIGRDQPSLREVLWDRPHLRLAILPEEYNFWDPRRLDRLNGDCQAPRILHNNTFTLPKVAEMDGGEMELLLGHARIAHLNALLKGDEAISETTGVRPERGGSRYVYTKGYIKDMPRKARALLQKLKY